MTHLDKSPPYVAHAESRKGDCVLLAFGCAPGWAGQQQNVSCVAFGRHKVNFKVAVVDTSPLHSLEFKPAIRSPYKSLMMNMKKKMIDEFIYGFFCKEVLLG